MRTILAAVVSAVLLASSAIASDCCCSTGVPVRVSDGRSEMPNRDGYFLRDGKVMISKGGVVGEAPREVALDDGTRILADGTLVMKDGHHSRLEANQWLNFDGRIDVNTSRMDARDVSHSNGNTAPIQEQRYEDIRIYDTTPSVRHEENHAAEANDNWGS